MPEHAYPGDEAMAELVDAIGDQAARVLARAFGGTTLYVPRQLGENHPLHVTLGAKAAKQLAAVRGGERLNIPKQPERRMRVRELYSQGDLTIAAIAIETGYSERHVYRLIGEIDAPQPDLFGNPFTSP